MEQEAGEDREKNTIMDGLTQWHNKRSATEMMGNVKDPISVE